jgi:hypothetical protein
VDESAGALTVEERIAALEQERNRVESDMEIPADDRERILADLDRQIQNLLAGGTEGDGAEPLLPPGE